MKTHVKKSIASTVILALALATPALADLSQDDPATRPTAPFPATLPLADLGQDDAKAAIQDPSTIKIPSNAHAADAGNGILFKWDTKQKDDTVVTVTAPDGVLTSFSIIVQSSGNYFIGQVKIIGSGSVKINKPSHNINMVYIAGLKVTTDPDELDPESGTNGDIPGFLGTTPPGDLDSDAAAQRDIADPQDPPPPTGLNEAVIRYYAICQLWNDLMWGNDGYGLTTVYNLTEEEKGLMMPVGIAHRDALQDWWGIPRGEQDVRYIPVATMAADFAAEWADIILYDGEDGFSLQDVCDRLGIDVEDFIANYDTEGFLDRNNLW